MIGITAMLVLSAGLLGFSNANAQGRGISYKVTVTNITKGQILSPSVVATHNNRAAPLFELGEPASDELAMLAEDAVIEPLIEKLKADRNVDDVQTLFGANGPILPGESASVVVQSGGLLRQVTVAGMLVTTNDAFFALNGEIGPLLNHKATHLVPAYDAGSEANNQDCNYIPGPPCGNPLMNPGEGAEGYVYIHAGIHDFGDLDPAMHDWQNPVAKITIERMR
jgi:hypothetical protein